MLFDVLHSEEPKDGKSAFADLDTTDDQKCDRNHPETARGSITLYIEPQDLVLVVDPAGWLQRSERVRNMSPPDRKDCVPFRPAVVV